MLRSFFSFCLILLYIISPAQQDSTLSKYVPLRTYTIISTELLPYLDYSNGASARIILERTLNKDWSVYGRGGIYFEHGYLVRTGIKRLMPGEGKGRYFLGLEYTYMSHIHTVNDYFRKPNGSGDYEPDEDRPFHFTEDKHNHLIDLMMGFDEFWRYGLVIQWFAGAGIKFRNARISAPDSTVVQLYHYHESMAEGAGATQGSSLLPDLRLGVRFGVFFASRRRREL